MREIYHPYEALLERSRNSGDQAAAWVLKLGNKSFEGFQKITWKDLLDRVQRYGVFLRKLGLQKGDRVAILARNGIEWVTLDLACLASGYVSVPLYTHSHEDEIRQILHQSGAKILFTDELWPSTDVRQENFGRAEEEIKKISSESFQSDFLPPDSTVSIIYTSGTSGNPKGVMHSAENFCRAVRLAADTVFLNKKDIFVSYLPLSHVVERCLIEFGSLYTGAQVYYLDRIEKLPNYLTTIRPTVFHSVPRIWDMMRNKIERELEKSNLVQKRLSALPFFLRNWILGYFIRRKLGLSRLRLAVSGAAKLQVQTAEAFKSWGILIHEGYGLTETLCVSAINPVGKGKFGSVGRLYSGVDVRVESDGELCFKAPFHFQGYYNDPELTQEAIDPEGWFHTGDVGRIDAEGYVFITDRKKHLFKSSGGKYIAPLPIEMLLKAYPGVREAVLIGEDQAHCVALISAELRIIGETQLQRMLASINAKLPSHEQIKALGCVDQIWSPQTGELTPSMKLKRKVVLEKYKNEILSLYNGCAKIQFFSTQPELRKESVC